LSARHTLSKSKNHGTYAPKKPENGDFWTNIHGWGGYRDGISVDLWGAGLLTIRAARIVLAATVFVIGVLSGAGVAAWMMPPVWVKCNDARMRTWSLIGLLPR
jgi:hypothetical protein